MCLFISNPSRQYAVFYFRDPNNLVASVEIPPGGQIQLNPTWKLDQVFPIITQLERFGARDASEMSGNLAGFTGLLYHIERPVEREEIETAHEAVLESAQQRSAREAVRSGLAFDRSARKEAGKRHTQPARVTTIEVEEEIQPGQRKKDDKLAFSLTIDPEGRSDVKLPT